MVQSFAVSRSSEPSTCQQELCPRGPDYSCSRGLQCWFKPLSLDRILLLRLINRRSSGHRLAIGERSAVFDAGRVAIGSCEKQLQGEGKARASARRARGGQSKGQYQAYYTCSARAKEGLVPGVLGKGKGRASAKRVRLGQRKGQCQTCKVDGGGGGRMRAGAGAASFDKREGSARDGPVK